MSDKIKELLDIITKLQEQNKVFQKQYNITGNELRQLREQNKQLKEVIKTSYYICENKVHLYLEPRNYSKHKDIILNILENKEIA